jgi:hypothetical protein
MPNTCMAQRLEGRDIGPGQKRACMHSTPTHLVDEADAVGVGPEARNLASRRACKVRAAQHRRADLGRGREAGWERAGAGEGRMSAEATERDRGRHPIPRAAACQTMEGAWLVHAYTSCFSLPSGARAAHHGASLVAVDVLEAVQAHLPGLRALTQHVHGLALLQPAAAGGRSELG